MAAAAAISTQTGSSRRVFTLMRDERRLAVPILLA
jgi:hypothetical protein